MPEFLDLHGRTSKALRALTETEMRRHGLHFGQDLVLAALWERDGRTPGEVAGALHVTTPTIVKMATRMTDRRTAHPPPRRPGQPPGPPLAHRCRPRPEGASPGSTAGA